MSDSQPSFAYRFLRTLFRWFIRLTIDIDAQGLERTPREGPLLITANHMSIFEGPIVFALIPRVPISVFAKKEWEESMGRHILNVIDAVYVSRGEVDRKALKEILARLKRGEAFGIAPEGTRSASGKLIEAKEGAAYIASLSDAWVLPVAVWGQEKAFEAWRRLRRPKVHLRVGEPFKLEPDPTKSRQENLEADTRQIMHALARLLPESYRGFYANEVLGPPEW